jgi:outer membrane protein assembly factor BamB
MTLRRNIVLGIAAVAWVTVAILFATGSISGAHTAVPPSGASPACLPPHLNESTLLANSKVTVSPAPESGSASASTQVSFLGVPVTEISNVAVEGTRTGYHHGHLYGYFQGDGGSFVSEKPFAHGETVHVRAQIGSGTGESSLSYSFKIATPYPTAGIPEFPAPPAPPSSVQSFQSAPGFHPPILSVTTPDEDPKAGEVMMTIGPGPGQYGPLIYRSDGTLVWFDPLERGIAAEGLRVQRYEGQDVLTWWQGKVLSLGFGDGEDIVMNSDYQRVATLQAGNGYEADLHDFQLAPHNVAYLTVYDPIRCDLRSVGGARNGVLIDTAVQALDIKTGLVRWEWHSLENVDVHASHAPVPKEAIPWDWFHLNSVDPQGDGHLLVSGRSMWAAYELDERSGTIQWQLGGEHSTFAMGPGAETAWQHDVRLQPNGTITAFDNGSTPRIHYQSRGVRIAVDTRRRTATLARAYTHPGAPLLADSQGDLQALPDGNVVIGWGAIPGVSEFSPGGSLLFDAHMPPGGSSYRAFRFPWSGRPLWQPAATARVLAGEDQTAVFASWNGATDVAYWRVLAGTDPGSMTGQATVRDTGFETSIIYPEGYAEHKAEYVAVEALDARGRVLALSPTIAVTPPPPAAPKG